MITLHQLLNFARLHDCSNEGVAFIDGDAVQIPIDCKLPDGRWIILWERAETLREARDALGY